MGQASARRLLHASGAQPRHGLSERYRQIRAMSEALAAPLSEADATIQSMADASPAKWHLAHTTWFFETFLLREHRPDQPGYAAGWPFLFNSYYEAEGPRIARDRRGMLSRPSLRQVLDYRAHVDRAIEQLLDDPACQPLLELGMAHEQQHQELLLTDIKHALFHNPLEPAMFAVAKPLAGDEATGAAKRSGWNEHAGGVVAVGHDGTGFAFDCEGPRQQVLLQPFALATRLVTNAEWESFIADGGYRTASLWLADGWDWVRRERITAPLYWSAQDHFTHAGRLKRDPAAPVSHVSYYEAEAFARWAGARLPTETEWEAAAGEEDPAAGNQLDRADAPLPSGGEALFGDCWQWTGSAYLPYPRFAPAGGAVGEYNGKFMAGQFVLKGASCATPRGHSRASYRNFFYPHQRWQFSGVRLASDRG